MKPSPLHLEGYHLAEFYFKVNEAFEKKTVFGSSSGYHYQTDKTWKVEPTEFTVAGVVGRHTEDSSRLRYTLKIASTGRKDQSPYSFRLSLIGYFHFHKDSPSVNEFLLVYASAPALLYGAAREILATLSGRGPYPAVLLPTASFLDEAKEKAEETLKEIKSLRAVRTKQITAGTKKAVKRRTKATKK